MLDRLKLIFKKEKFYLAVVLPVYCRNLSISRAKVHEKKFKVGNRRFRSGKFWAVSDFSTEPSVYFPTYSCGRGVLENLLSISQGKKWTFLIYWSWHFFILSYTAMDCTLASSSAMQGYSHCNSVNFEQIST